ncbi:sugar nucleotide-binding protein [Candidatus Mycosynbacter amalyticus]|uniref:dTDP-4-dehydrorhamnose reductase n=1 Tax=Candidatus Mycosynbacter amalyticus TaxID=2665156 RepID=A0A857MQI9_9BACT|nr:bifunctional dTDP-4-dehydrorhamnose 3,5-epimerase family protein/NAD(P)-dependent oxidoreductase [Candidatus Mycosynbacter amalyticus]QHN43321.1 sugar nucleotide-binding protein [Candidatus Mycosynbacter amalyticus]
MADISSEIEFNKQLKSYETSIDGLVVYDLPVFGDNRGWFKENWQREKMTAVGLPDFGPVQNNFSFNDKRGVARGIHAEPWDKYVSLGSGRIFGFWVDIREGSATYGEHFTVELDPSKAIFVPRGVANGYQTLEDNTVYSYLVNDHWSPDAQYSFVSMFDESIGIDWPIPLSECEISDKDKNHPNLADAVAIKPKKTLIVGANGQLGRALQVLYPEAECVDRDSLDISSPDVFTARRWRDYGTILNAAAYTAVDLAETEQGRRDAWTANATAVANLARIATEYGITLVHVSSDYVFDGTAEQHTEDEDFAPLGVYGQSKAAGDIVVSTTPCHYIARTSWVIGDGNNFVRTMNSLAEKGIKPSVVSDQIGRLTFTEDLAAGIKHLLDNKAPFGTYNISNDGEPASWADIAAEVYELSGKSRDDVTQVTTEQYYEGKTGIAPRPLQSTLNLEKIKATGFAPREWKTALTEYLEK